MVIRGKQTLGVTAVTRALSILGVFNAGDTELSLSEIARRTRLPKTTVLRIARTMAAAQFLVQLEDGSWRLGAACGWAGYCYNVAFDAVIVEPVLRDVCKQTMETVSYYVREGQTRICVARVDGSRSPRHHVRIGEILPLTRAAGGVLLAFSNEPGELYEDIRRLGFHSTFERSSRTGSIACPVFGVNHALVGCLSMFGPRGRFDRNSVARYTKILCKAAAQLTFELGVSHSARNERPHRTRPFKENTD